jgi:quercetin dioxygenase-like cupin family protein
MLHDKGGIMQHIDPQTSKGPKEMFTGDVYPTIILAGQEPSRVRVASVHFAPGAHTAWHSHAVGQYLHVTEGTALVQERGGKIETLKPGDTIYTPPNVEHWHGATKDSFMVHLAIFEAPAPDSGEPETKWLAHVTPEEYNQQHSKN